jgi:hypothetical protein
VSEETEFQEIPNKVLEAFSHPLLYLLALFFVKQVELSGI